MKPRLRLRRQESHDATRARIIDAVKNKDVSAPVHPLVAVRGWVTSLWRQKKWSFWILITIALIVVFILGIVTKVLHQQPQYDRWLDRW